jgi:transposase
MVEARVVEQSVLIEVAAVAAPARVKAPVHKSFRRYDQDQPLLLPPDLRDWLPADHPARLVDDLVEHGLDLSEIYAGYTEVRGAPPYDPRLMVKLLLYGYSHGVSSSRAIERRCHDDVAFRFLTADSAPDFVAIARFRVRHGAALKAMFIQSLALCGRAGLVRLGRVALDGTKVRADASRHKAMSYGRMVKTEAELAAEVDQLLAAAAGVDAAEDAEFGTDRRGDDLPAELVRRESRLATIRAAREQLEAEHAEAERVKAETAAREAGLDEAAAVVVGQAAADTAVVPERAQRSFTDPDARIMKTSDGSFHYCYNGQLVVDDAAQVILAGTLTQCPTDVTAVPGMLTTLTEQLTAAGVDGLPRTLLADAGYFSADNVTAISDAGIDPLIATGRLRRGEVVPDAPRGRIPAATTPKQRMARKCRTKKGRADYARRKSVVEPVFGQIQTCQDGGRLRLRGKVKTDREWFLHLACHNFRKLFRSGWRPKPATA